MIARHVPAPVATGAIAVLLVIMALCWGQSGGSGVGAFRTATVRNVRADLADAGCIFTADVELGNAWQQFTFARVRDDARRQFRTIMRGKRRYMVENAVERQALAVELAGAINRLARAEIAERVDFPRFELF